MAAATLTGHDLVARLGGRYADAIGIRLAKGERGEIFKWFLAALLYGAPIQEGVAKRTYLAFAAAGVLTPQRVLATGWDGLVAVLDAGGYVRYDYKTATKLLAVCAALQDGYAGDLNGLHEAATSPADLEARLMALGKGVGPVTVNIFLRELRGIWAKARPLPQEGTVAAARAVGLLRGGTLKGAAALARLQRRWAAEGGHTNDFADLEAALQRHGRDLRRRAAPAAQ